MAWIRWIAEEDATGPLKDYFERVTTRHGVDNILKIHSLNPESLWHHYSYYDHLMRGPSKLPRGEREMIAVAVSNINECFY